jgi:type I restriction enzyme M protein
MKADGFSLDDKRSPVEQNDIPDVIARFNARFTEPERERDQQSFFVPKDEIVGNDYDLSVNKYKKIEYVAEEYPPTSQLLAEINDLETQFQKELKALKGLLDNE